MVMVLLCLSLFSLCRYARAGDRLVRLAGGTSLSEGRVEVRVRGKWGTVCNHSWDNVDAFVACKSVGLAGGQAVGGVLFGQGVGAIYMKDVACLGGEESLEVCAHSSHTSKCTHSEDAGVVCDNASEHRPNLSKKRLGLHSKTNSNDIDSSPYRISFFRMFRPKLLTTAGQDRYKDAKVIAYERLTTEYSVFIHPRLEMSPVHKVQWLPSHIWPGGGLPRDGFRDLPRADLFLDLKPAVPLKSQLLRPSLPRSKRQADDDSTGDNSTDSSSTDSASTDSASRDNANRDNAGIHVTEASRTEDNTTIVLNKSNGVNFFKLMAAAALGALIVVAVSSYVIWYIIMSRKIGKSKWNADLKASKSILKPASSYGPPLQSDMGVENTLEDNTEINRRRATVLSESSASELGTEASTSMSEKLENSPSIDQLYLSVKL